MRHLRVWDAVFNRWHSSIAPPPPLHSRIATYAEHVAPEANGADEYERE